MTCYELRIAYDSDTTLGEGDVRGRYQCLTVAAYELIRCSAPFKQILAEDEDGRVRYLNQQEDAYVEELARRHGWEMEEVEG
jgi:hypothetical protein